MSERRYDVERELELFREYKSPHAISQDSSKKRRGMEVVCFPDMSATMGRGLFKRAKA